MQVEHVERLIDNCVHVFISPLVAAIVHSNYWQVALASIYVCISVCHASCKFLSLYTLHSFPIVPDVSHAITSEPLKSGTKL